MAGRPKLPVEIKRQRGTLRSYDKGQEEQEKAVSAILPVGKLSVPKTLTDPGIKKAFKNHVELLRAIGAETKADSPLLEQAYIALQSGKECYEKMEKLDVLDEEYDGLSDKWLKYTAKFERIVKEFYLTPTARAKLKLDSLTATEKQLNIEKGKSAVASLLEKKQS